MTTKDWLNIVKRNPVAFAIEAGYDRMSSLHNSWIKEFLYGDEALTLQAHRGSFKTTCVTTALALLVIISPDTPILFMRKTDEDVKEVIRAVKNLLLSDMLQTFSYALYGQYVALMVDSATGIDTNLKVGPQGTLQLSGQGIKGSITGKHFDRIFTDDIINIQDRYSKAERDTTKRIYQELQNILNDSGRIINTGTPWHKEDAFMLMPNIKKYDCYSTGMMADRTLQELRSSMSPSLFAANYELKHIADEEAMFSNPVIDDGSNTEKIYDGISHIDASYGGPDGTAFTVIKEYEGKLYVYGMLRKKHVDDLLPIIEAKRELYRSGTNYLEDNADKGYLREKVKEPTFGYHESTNKFIKISTYLRENWERIIFIKGTDEDYINQILDYTENAEHDDAPDSLASAIRILTRDTSATVRGIGRRSRLWQ